MLSGVLSVPYPQPSSVPSALGYESAIAPSYRGCMWRILTVTLPAIWGAIWLKLGRSCISKAPDPAPSLASLTSTSRFQVRGMGLWFAYDRSSCKPAIRRRGLGSFPYSGISKSITATVRFPALGADEQTRTERGFTGTEMKKAELG